MSNTSSAMTSGDCLVVKRSDGLFEVYKVWAGGARQPVSDSISDRRAAWQLASSLLTPDGETVYFKEAGEPDSAIRPHPVPEEQLRMAYA
jgi:hypothetical protein